MNVLERVRAEFRGHKDTHKEAILTRLLSSVGESVRLDDIAVQVYGATTDRYKVRHSLIGVDRDIANSGLPCSLLYRPLVFTGQGHQATVMLTRTTQETERLYREGRRREERHIRRERDPNLRRDKLAQMIATHGRLFCEQCKRDKDERAPPEAWLEVHHRETHVADMPEYHVSRVRDCECLCAHCHKIEHWRIRTGAN
jgi:hypothetical protein